MLQYHTTESIESGEVVVGRATDIKDKSYVSTYKKIGVSIAVALAMFAGFHKISSPANFQSSLSSGDASVEWKNRPDVQEYSSLKVVYGSMNEDDVRGLFNKFKADHRRAYDSQETEATRFGLFKGSLKEIDFLNKRNPLALFGITESADLTKEEKAKRKMSSKWSDYSAMKASLPTEMVEAAMKGPEAVVGKTFSDAQSVSEFAWADPDDCAACTMFPDLANYNLTHAPKDFDWRALGAVTSVKNQKYCGSCWTFSTAGDVEGTHFLATGNLTSFSEQQLVACDTKNYGSTADGCMPPCNIYRTSGSWFLMLHTRTKGYSWTTSYQLQPAIRTY